MNDIDTCVNSQSWSTTAQFGAVAIVVSSALVVPHAKTYTTDLVDATACTSTEDVEAFSVADDMYHRAVANARKLAQSEDVAHNKMVDELVAANMAGRKSTVIKKRL